jgi:hypothetical protein
MEQLKKLLEDLREILYRSGTPAEEARVFFKRIPQMRRVKRKGARRPRR